MVVRPLRAGRRIPASGMRAVTPADFRPRESADRWTNAEVPDNLSARLSRKKSLPENHLLEGIFPMRRFIVISLCVGCVGCGADYRPAKRETPAERETPAHLETPVPPVQQVSPPAPAVESAATPEGGAVEMAAIRLTAPDTWVRQQPRSQFITAEFSLPRAEGDASDGRLTISVAGGSIDDNLERWRGQFEGERAREVAEDLPIAGVTVKLLDCSGTYIDQPGPFAPGVPRAGYRMIGAVIPVGQQLHFVKAYGPEKTMAQYEPSFRAFLQSLEVKP